MAIIVIHKINIGSIDKNFANQCTMPSQICRVFYSVNVVGIWFSFATGNICLQSNTQKYMQL
jgi:hypothetical protein